MVFYTGFPAEVDNNLRVVIGISLSSGQAISLPAIIPQAQLMSIVLINQASLQTAVGSLIGSIALFSEVRLCIVLTAGQTVKSLYSYISSISVEYNDFGPIVIALHVCIDGGRACMQEPITSPLPTVVPSPLDVIIENAILIIIEQAPITQVYSV